MDNRTEIRGSWPDFATTFSTSWRIRWSKKAWSGKVVGKHRQVAFGNIKPGTIHSTTIVLMSDYIN